MTWPCGGKILRVYCMLSEPWLLRYNRKVAGSIPDGLIGILHWYNSSGRTMALGLTQPLTEINTKNISWGKGGRCVRLTTFPPSCADCLEIWEPQPPGTLRACPGLWWDYFTFFLNPDISSQRFVQWQVRGISQRSLQMLISGPRRFRISSNVLGILNYADGFLVDLQGSRSADSSTRALTFACVFARPLVSQLAPNRSGLYVIFSSLPKSSSVGPTLLKCKADFAVISS